MSGPTFSPDGDWMWNGTEWIPAPPKKQVLPKSAIDQAEVKYVANESGVEAERLRQVAPYFDQNNDRILQQTELQQAAMSISHEPNIPYPQPMHGQQFAPSAPMGGMMPESRSNAPSALNWVALGLTAAAVTLIFIAMFSGSWMTGEDDGTDVYFGLSDYEFSDSSNTINRDYSSSSCQSEPECEDIGDAGTTGLVFLWIAVAFSMGSLVFLGIDSILNHKSKFGMISSFVGGGLTILGVILWFIVFPDLDLDSDYDLGPGYAFYLAMIGGLLGISAGIVELIAGRSGGSLKAPMHAMPQQHYGQEMQYRRW